AGIFKDRFLKAARQKKAAAINRLLHVRYIRKKHLTVYLLEFLRDHGLRKFFRMVAHAGAGKGLKAWLQPRQLLLSERQNPALKMPVLQQIPEKEPEEMRKESAEFSIRPRISLILPTYNTPVELLAAALRSVRRQYYEKWELCIVDDHSTDKETIQF